MALDNMLDDGEAEAGSAAAPAPCCIDAIESFGQPRQMFAGNARPMVGHCDIDPSRGCIGRDIDPARRIVAAVPQCITEQVIEDLEKLAVVASDRRYCFGHLSFDFTF